MSVQTSAFNKSPKKSIFSNKNNTQNTQNSQNNNSNPIKQETVNTFVKGYSNYLNMDENKVEIIKYIEKVTNKPSSFTSNPTQNQPASHEDKIITNTNPTINIENTEHYGKLDMITSKSKMTTKFVDLKDITK